VNTNQKAKEESGTSSAFVAASISQNAAKEGATHDKTLIVFHAILVTGTAFILNYAWENVQCPLFFVHRGGSAKQVAMLYATVGDLFMTWIAYIAVALTSKRWLWLLGTWRWQQWTVLLGTALTLSVLVESFALATSRWSYTDINPLIPGTGISVLPVAQLVLLFPAAFGVSRKLLCLTDKPSGTARDRF
jgi:hypothetical protein